MLRGPTLAHHVTDVAFPCNSCDNEGCAGAASGSVHGSNGGKQMGSDGIDRDWRVNAGGMLKECSEPGCATLTLGGTCVAHDAVVVALMPRGVPHGDADPTPGPDAPLAAA